MKTYNFLVILGKFEKMVEINAKSQEKAIKIIRKEYPSDEGGRYILI